MLQALGVHADRRLIHGEPECFTITKAFHSKWIWRCHIDSSTPDKDVSLFLRPYLEEYDAVVPLVWAVSASSEVAPGGLLTTWRSAVSSDCQRTPGQASGR
ncbi:MAG TPA: hypothetical protein PKD12_19505, partial [Nitrospira sp.]|nr:hypothetical protein [Nitrospira sp.]